MKDEKGKILNLVPATVPPMTRNDRTLIVLREHIPGTGNPNKMPIPLTEDQIVTRYKFSRAQVWHKMRNVPLMGEGERTTIMGR